MPMNPSGFLFFIVLACLGGLPPLSIDMNLPAIPAIEGAFGVAAGQGALTFSFFLLGFAVAPVVGGPLSDRYGRRPTLIASLALISLGAFACMLDESFHFLLAARLVQGAACGSCVLAPLAIIRDTLSGPAARRKLSGIMFIMGVAPLAAPIAGSLVLQLGGWRAIYGVQGGLGLILLLLIAFGFAETLPPERRASLNVRDLARRYATLFSNRAYLGLALPMAFGFGCMFSYIAGSPGLMLNEIGLSEQTYSLAFAFTSLGLMGGSLISAFLGRHEVATRTIVAGSLIVLILAVGTIALTLWETGAGLPLLLGLFFMVLLCFGLIQPNAMSEAVAPWGEMAGTASGGLNSLQMFVGAGAGALVTLLAGSLSPGRAMSGAMLAMALLAGAGFLLSPARVRRAG